MDVFDCGGVKEMKNVAFTCDYCGKTIVVPVPKDEAYKALSGWMGIINLSSLYTEGDISDKVERTFCSEECVKAFVKKLKD